MGLLTFDFLSPPFDWYLETITTRAITYRCHSDRSLDACFELDHMDCGLLRIIGVASGGAMAITSNAEGATSGWYIWEYWKELIMERVEYVYDRVFLPIPKRAVILYMQSWHFGCAFTYYDCVFHLHLSFTCALHLTITSIAAI